MPLGTNPTFLQVQAFFGGGNAFSQYYRGGPYVPNIPANYAIPTSPEGMALRQFSGADKVTSPPVPTWVDASTWADIFVTGNGGSCNAYIDIRPDGMVFTYSSTNGSGNAYQWLPGGRSAGEYMARRSVNGGPWEGWQSLGTTYSAASSSAYSDGFYSETDSVTSVVQIGYAGNVQAQATFSVSSSASGRG